MSDEPHGVAQTPETPAEGSQSVPMILFRIAVMFVIVPVAVMMAALYFF